MKDYKDTEQIGPRLNSRRSTLFEIENLVVTYRKNNGKKKPIEKQRNKQKHDDQAFSLAIDRLSIPERCITVLIGSNGSGKTTLLKAMNYLHRCSGEGINSSGDIFFHGQPIPGKGLSRLRQESVLVHQKPYIFRDTVYGNIQYSLNVKLKLEEKQNLKTKFKIKEEYSLPNNVKKETNQIIHSKELNTANKTHEPYEMYAARKLTKKDIHHLIMEQLKEVGLDHLAYRKARTLSGGEKQRLAVARALITNPKLLLLDEPTGNIDPVSALTLERVIKERVAAGMTVIMTTHNLASAYRLGDNIVSLDHGRQVDLGMNVLKGKVEERDDYFLYFRAGNALLRCPALDGEFSVAVIPTDDIIISKKNISTSAQNNFLGVVRDVSSQLLGRQNGSQSQSLYIITLDCGVSLQVMLTKRSLEEMNIRPGTKVTAIFKTSAVRLY